MKMRLFGWAAFVLLSFCVACYRHFPGPALSAYLVQGADRHISGLSVKLEDAVPVLPLGIKLAPASIDFMGLLSTRFDQLTVRGSLSSFFSHTLDGSFQGKMNPGQVTGRFSVPRQEGDPTGFEAAFKNLSLGQVVSGAKRFDVDLEGRLSGEVRGKIFFGRNQRKTGSGNIRIKEMVCTFLQKDFFLETLTMTSVAVDFVLSAPDNLEIVKCTMNGPELTLESFGKISLPGNGHIENSRLDLIATVVIHPGFFIKASLPGQTRVKPGGIAEFDVAVTGTVQNPEVNIVGDKT